jgi:Butirosin biosynthesis protein H, N-terminal/Domain of unknown function (DUF4872)
MILDAYKMIGGIHPETASIKNILNFYGVNAPHTNRPFTEAMLLGIGGGLGSCYMLWEFEKYEMPSIVLAFGNKCNYDVKYLQILAARLGATNNVFETMGKKKAGSQLKQVLENGVPAITWLDLGAAPYYMHYLEVGVAVVYGIDNDAFLVDLLASKHYRIEADLMTTARAKIPSFKNRIMTITPNSPINIQAAICQGLQDHLDYLGGSSSSFALPAIRKWSRLMTDKKNAKGWPNVFKNGIGLYGSLRTIYEAVEHIGGGTLRGMYADFLEESSLIFNEPRLADCAQLYRSLHQLWGELAQLVLPDQVGAFRTTKDMLDQRAAIRLAHGSAGLNDINSLNDKLHQLKTELNHDFPMSHSGILDLFSDIQLHLTGLYKAEKEALSALQSITSEMA